MFNQNKDLTFKIATVMKNSIKTIICAFAFATLFAFNANADDKESKKATSFGTGIFASKEGKIQVNVDKYNNAPTAVTLEDDKGNLAYREIVTSGTKKFRRTLDVAQLPAGNYTLKIVSGGDKQTKTFEILDKTAARSITLNQK